MPFQYHRVLMLGGTAGIGAALADRLVLEGSKVIAVGRRQERLDAFVQKHGAAKASGIKFDITDREGLDGFVSSVTKQYPDLDCVFLNAGVQKPYNLTQPASIDLSGFHAEVNTNFSAIVDLSVKFLPFLQAKQTPTSIIYTGSNLAFVPAATLPAYSASKAALNTFVLCLREQLRAAESSVKIIEVSPPPVQTELHDYMGPERGRSLGMPLDQFTDEAYQSLESGSDEIVIGTIANGPAEFKQLIDTRRKLFEGLAKMMRGGK